jgi:hypothetical protein
MRWRKSLAANRPRRRQLPFSDQINGRTRPARTPARF